MEYNPTPMADESGRSVSSEGDIANHHPFNSIADVISGKKGVGEKDLQSSKRKNGPARSPAAQAEQIPDRASPNRRPRKTIIYSDKSESSVDEMMADTPSNYNIPNGRLDGKSLGLKAILLHAKAQGGNTIDPTAGPGLGVIKEAPMSPQMLQSNQYKSNPLAGDKDGRFVSNLYN